MNSLHLCSKFLAPRFFEMAETRICHLHCFFYYVWITQKNGLRQYNLQTIRPLPKLSNSSTWKSKLYFLSILMWIMCMYFESVLWSFLSLPWLSLWSPAVLCQPHLSAPTHCPRESHALQKTTRVFFTRKRKRVFKSDPLIWCQQSLYRMEFTPYLHTDCGSAYSTLQREWFIQYYPNTTESVVPLVYRRKTSVHFSLFTKCIEESVHFSFHGTHSPNLSTTVLLASVRLESCPPNKMTSTSPGLRLMAMAVWSALCWSVGTATCNIKLLHYYISTDQASNVMVKHPNS